jgi:hypothetical protein
MQESRAQIRCERTCRAAETAQWIDENVFVAAEREVVDWVR